MQTLVHFIQTELELIRLRRRSPAVPYRLFMYMVAQRTTPLHSMITPTPSATTRKLFIISPWYVYSLESTCGVGDWNILGVHIVGAAFPSNRQWLGGLAFDL